MINKYYLYFYKIIPIFNIHSKNMYLYIDNNRNINYYSNNN